MPIITLILIDFNVFITLIVNLSHIIGLPNREVTFVEEVTTAGRETQKRVILSLGEITIIENLIIRSKILNCGRSVE